jgi:hypothetical protein
MSEFCRVASANKAVFASKVTEPTLWLAEAAQRSMSAFGGGGHYPLHSVSAGWSGYGILAWPNDVLGIWVT